MTPKDDGYTVTWSGRDPLTGDYPWASPLVTAVNHRVRESIQDDRPTKTGHPCACGCGGFSLRGHYCQGHGRRHPLRNADAAHRAA
jgi:hypothetical protein